MRITLGLTLVALAAAILIGCSSSSSSNKTPTIDAPSAAGDVTDVSAASNSAKLTPGASSATAAPAIPVLPSGAAVDATGSPVAPDVATDVAVGLAGADGASGGSASGGPPGNPTAGAIAADTPAVPPTEVATEAPLCVERPTPGCGTPPPVSTAIVPDAQGIVIDTDPSTPAVDTRPIAAASGQTFSVGIDVATAPQPYQGYEWDLIIEGPISYVSSDQAKPANLTLCSATTHIGDATANEYYSGCLSTDNNITYTGPVDTVTLQCSGPGSGRLRLMKQDGGTPFGTDLLNQSAQPITGDVGPAVTVICG